MTTPANLALEPCPWCGGVTHLYQNLQDSSQIQCMSCQAVGPHVYGGNKAVAAWNGGALRERVRELEADNAYLRKQDELQDDDIIRLQKELNAAEARVAELQRAVDDLNAALESKYLRGRDDGVRIGFERAREDYYEEKYTSADQVIAELRGES